MRQKIKRSEGFTLIELLLGATIFSIIIGAAYAVFTTGLGLKEKADKRLLILQSARFTLRRMREDLQSAALFGRAETYLFEGIDGQDASGRDDDTIDFLSFSNNSKLNEYPASDQCEIGYLIYSDPERGIPILYRRADITPDDNITEGGTYLEIAEGVVSLNIEYYDGIAWQDNYQSSKELPQYVRVTIGLAASADKGVPVREYKAFIRLAQYSPAQGRGSEK